MNGDARLAFDALLLTSARRPHLDSIAGFSKSSRDLARVVANAARLRWILAGDDMPRRHGWSATAAKLDLGSTSSGGTSLTLASHGVQLGSSATTAG